jgi:hypothetical protein
MYSEPWGISSGNWCALGFDTVQHRCVRLSGRYWIPFERVPKRRTNSACSRQETPVRWISAIFVSGDEQTSFVPSEILEGFGELGVVDRGVESTYDGTYSGVRGEREVKRVERVIHRILYDKYQRYVFETCGLKHTVPPRYDIPSSASSSSSPFIPIT